MVAIHREGQFLVLQLAADEQRQRTFCSLEFVALVLQFLDASEDGLQLRRIVVSRKPSSCAFITMLLRPARSLTSTRRRLPTSAGSMCS